jgi:hypothetical protein
MQNQQNSKAFTTNDSGTNGHPLVKNSDLNQVSYFLQKLTQNGYGFKCKTSNSKTFSKIKKNWSQWLTFVILATWED